MRIDEFPDGDARVLDERLLEEDALAQVAVESCLRSPFRARLRGCSSPRPRKLPRGAQVGLLHVFARAELRVHRRDMHRDIVGELPELLVLGYEIRLAGEDDRADDLPPAWVYAAATPAPSSRSAFFEAIAALALRKITFAFSMSPPASSSAFLHCMIETPVMSRSSFNFSRDLP